MKFVKRAITVFSGNIAFALSTLITASVLISKSGLEQYGLFILLQACFQSWCIISKPLTWQAIVKFQDVCRMKDLISMSLRLELIAAIILTPIAIVAIIIISREIPSLTEFSKIAIVTVVTATIYNNGTVTGWLRAERRFFVLSVIQYWSAASKVALALYLYNDIELLFICSLAADALGWMGGLIYLGFRQTKSVNIPSNKDRTQLNEFAKFSYWGTLHAILDLPLTQLDKIIISSVSGVEVAGILNLIRRISGVLNQIADPIYQVSFPEFSTFVHNRDYIRAKAVCYKLALQLSIVGVAVTLGSILFFPELNKFVFNGKLEGYRIPLALAIAVQTLSLAFIWIHPLFLAFGLMKEITKIIVMSNGFYILSLVYLVPTFEVYGAIVAIFIQFALVVLYKTIILKKHTKFFQRPIYDI